MSNVITIDTLAGQFESYSELQKYCDNQYKTLQIIQKENTALKKEIEHLKDLLSSTTTLMSSSVESFQPTNEELICEIQLTKLKDKAFQRELTLEETKRLEILVKSLHAIKEKSPSSIPTEWKNIQDKDNIEKLSLIANLPDKPSEPQ